MPVRKTGLACPKCEARQVTSHLLEAAPHVLGVYCETGNSEHKWIDTNELMALRPNKIDLPKPAPAPQQNRVALTVNVPAHLETGLRARYGDSLNENLVSLLQYGTQPDFLILTSEDLDRIQARMGFRPASGGELFGHIFQMGEELQEQKNTIKQLERTAGARKTGTGVVIDLEDLLPKAVSKSAESNMAVDEYLGTYLKEALTNDWIMV